MGLQAFNDTIGFSEAIVMGAAMWAGWAMFSIPFSLCSIFIGTVMINSPLNDKYFCGEFIVWLIDGLMKAGIASVLPVRNAPRLTVQKV